MGMERLHGSCHCGNIRVTVELPRPAASYSPRACDCTFCRRHGASYLSDPAGALRFHVSDMDALGRYRQGNALADFLYCRTCAVLVGVAYEEHGHMFATVNSRVIEDGTAFADTKPVSPATLGAAEKVARWKEVWFSDVALVDELPATAARPRP